eukprot:TRINITY_DN14367_c0_g1_i1.p1 TRINITY_DN14367_c0_g1~~TRINITY_DN14367_c0_g1_i1.p1  ORF type:complete len:144 (+),score=20.50 TRINITY_DN14367_c0_g1_i1:146-577(+)
MEGNVRRREDQLQQLSDYVKNGELFHSNNVIIMGDLNLHLPEEDRTIEKIGFVDFWKSTAEDMTGYTWDTHTNPLIGWFLPFDKRRMRLDRIIGYPESKWVCDPSILSGVKIFAQDAIYPNSHFSYLRCSDHYGLVTNIIFSP